MLRILIADGHPVLRAGVAQVLSRIPAVEIEQAGSMSQLQEALVLRPPKLLILGLDLPGGSALLAIPELRQFYPAVGILIFSRQPERTAGVSAILAGAHGFVSKTAAPEQLMEAVERVASGAHYVSESLDAALTEELRRGASAGKQPHETFSSREYAVMLRIARGFTTSEIAAQLNLNPRTVGAHRARILKKMRIKTTAELTRYVVKKGLDKS